MHSIRIHKVVGVLISFLHLIGAWHRGDKPTVKEVRVKLFYCIYYSVFVLSAAIGAMKSENLDSAIFLIDVSIGSTVVAIKIWILTWKQNEIINLLNLICGFSIRYDDDHKRFDNKIRGFIKMTFVFLVAVTATGSLASVFLSFDGSERNLFYKIAFPLDYENCEIAFWIATLFLFIECLLFVIATIFTIFIWYLLFVCALRYEVLGNELRNMGRTGDEDGEKKTEKKMNKNYFVDLKTSIDAHLHLRQSINRVESFFAKLFLIQFGISGLCICGSVYCLAFDIGDSLLERLLYLLVFLYFIFELFMITYLGNEIKLSSDRLSYSLFESDWYNQPQSTKKCIIIFGEYLKQPQELIIGKLYPLTLETFTRILNSAYSMFNILKSF